MSTKGTRGDTFAQIGITTHVLDTSTGKPAAAVDVVLEAEGGGKWKRVGISKTNADGRVKDWLTTRANFSLVKGMYRIKFNTRRYFTDRGVETFYPYVEIIFNVESAEEHYHVPLLVSPFAYSTYRGS